jgi:hypothetical protein
MLIALVLAATVNTYVSERCGFSFDYPATWTAVENPKAKIKDPDRWDALATCAVGLRPPRWPREMTVDKDVYELRRYPIRIVKWNRGFKESARASYFAPVSDVPHMQDRMKPWEWVIFVRQGVAPAQMFVTRCCQGVRGESWGHGYSNNYDKTGEKVTVIWEGPVVNDRKGHSIVIESDSAERFKPVVTLTDV